MIDRHIVVDERIGGVHVAVPELELVGHVHDPDAGGIGDPCELVALYDVQILGGTGARLGFVDHMVHELLVVVDVKPIVGRVG
jgi:hypothetical protein